MIEQEYDYRNWLKEEGRFPEDLEDVEKKKESFLEIDVRFRKSNRNKEAFQQMKRDNK